MRFHPIVARLQGLQMLLTDCAIRLRALQSVIEDVVDGVVAVENDQTEMLGLISGSLLAEVTTLERLIARLRPLADDLRNSG